MTIQPIEFDHTQDEIAKAIGLSAEQTQLCQERIFFSSFSNYLRTHNLFDSREEAPKDLTTFSGDLEQCLKLIQNPLEYQYTLLIFMTLQRQALKMVALHSLMDESKADEEDLPKIKLIKSFLNIEASFKKKEADILTDFAGVMRRIDFVERSNYNFTAYLNLLNGNSVKGNIAEFDVEDLLKNLGLN
jgi:hypothetical protein